MEAAPVCGIRSCIGALCWRLHCKKLFKEVSRVRRPRPTSPPARRARCSAAPLCLARRHRPSGRPGGDGARRLLAGAAGALLLRCGRARWPRTVVGWSRCSCGSWRGGTKAAHARGAAGAVAELRQREEDRRSAAVAGGCRTSSCRRPLSLCTLPACSGRHTQAGSGSRPELHRLDRGSSPSVSRRA